MNIAGWLTARRLRAHGLLLALALWSIYVWVLATPGLRDRYGNLKGTDFLHFYTLGRLAVEHRGDALYEMSAQAVSAAQSVPEAAGIRYLPLYPPQVSLMFAPLSELSYANALGLWWIISVLIYAACCYWIWRVCPNLKSFGGTVLLVAAAYPAFFNLIAWGQTSALALACFTISFSCFRKKHDFWAGALLGLLVFKPQLALATAILFFSMGAWQVISGAALSTLVELSVGVLYYGRQPLAIWLRTLWHVREVASALEPRPYQTHCLRTFWSMLIPWNSLSLAMYAITAGFVLVWTIQVWKRSPSWHLRFSMLLLATVLVAPHLTVYDLVILIPAFLLLADWLLSLGNAVFAGRIGVLLYLVYVLPLVGFVSRWTHVQVSVLAMMFLTYQIWKAVRWPNGPGNSLVPAQSGLARV